MYFTEKGLMPTLSHRLLPVERYFQIMPKNQELDVECSDGFVTVHRDKYGKLRTIITTGRLNL